MINFFDWLLGPEEPPRDRRRSPRYPALATRARLAWREEGRTREATARLLNLSHVGALVAADGGPAVGRTAWLRLEGPAPTGWVEATVVRRARSGKLGLDFAGPCPYEFFRAATQRPPREVAIPPEFADGYWR
jgi:hypothetical protein